MNKTFMASEGAASDTEKLGYQVTLSKNLSMLKKRDDALSTLREHQIDEAAELLFSDIEDIGIVTKNDLLMSQYHEIADRLFSSYSDPNKTSSPFPLACDENGEASLRIYLCSAICKARARKGFPLRFENFFSLARDTDTDGSRTVAYLKNQYSDTAYGIFSSVLDASDSICPTDFNGVCEAVYYGRARYCILPVESSVDGSLSGFRRLTEKYELCPVLSCFVPSREGDVTTRFTLFSKNVERIRVTSRGAKEYFSFRLNAPDDRALLDTVRCLRFCSLRLVRIDSSTVAWDAGRYSLTLTAECSGGDLPALLCYLSLEVPEYSPVGLYTQLYV